MRFSLFFLVCLAATASAQPGCGTTSHYGPSGVIRSPNHPGNYNDSLDCTYSIYGSNGSSFTLVFQSFMTEEVFDNVTISCATNSSFPPQTYSGTLLPNPISIPWCSQGRIRFYTNDAIISSGFSIDYSVGLGGCGNTVYGGSHGYVSSPGYPDRYGPNQNCSSIIYASQQSHFHLRFLQLLLPACSNCTCTFVEFSCYDNNPSDKQRFCGRSVVAFDIYQCTQVLMWFYSERGDPHEGFYLEYYIFPDGGAGTGSSTSDTSSRTSGSSWSTTDFSTWMTPQGSTQTPPDCGNTSYYGPSGVISSLNYTNDLYCNYYIYGSNGSSFTLVFQSFSTEPDYDEVTISCATNSSFPPQTYSGTLLPNPISVPWCSQARIRFTTDSSFVESGFSLDYSVGLGGCGNTVYGGSHGYASSPGYPARYGPDQNCSNIIYAPQPSHFHLLFLKMDSPDCNCTCDFVEISCYDNNPSEKRRFCGYDMSPIGFDIYQCTQVLVRFQSDSSDVYDDGFYLEYYIFPEAGTGTATGASTSVTGSGTSGSSWPTTDFSTRFTGQSSTQTPPVVDCGNTDYFGPSGVISSPNYPDDYPNYVACDYYITASSSSSSIAIIFKEFDTEQCCDYVTISCPTNSSHPSVRYSGFSRPQPFSIAWCSKGAINFSTNDATVNTGFSLDYHISLGGCGDTVYAGSHGYVSSPYYPSNYGDNHNCSNIIWTSQRSSFAITFQYMSVEECCDFVELSCLDNAEFGSHRFTGSTIPEKLDIPGCTQVLVWFNSDDSVAQTGFNLEYLAKPEKVVAV